MQNAKFIMHNVNLNSGLPAAEIEQKCGSNNMLLINPVS